MRLFAYGTLQQPELQMSLFGRLLGGRPATLPGYRLEALTITDSGVVELSGAATHPIAVATGRAADHIDGSVFAISAAELATADRYEVDDYTRALVPLTTGGPAWVYAASHSVDEPPGDVRP